jgi:tetratricopeptide (TPR) repeat protein
MQPYNQAYANAMRDVARAYPDDLDVQVLFAEAMMDANPWKLWTLDGKPAPGTEEIVATLEQVLARDPQHPGANHYYIHAVEASGQPDRAVAAADRLPGLMPGAGHIVHMPAHIYQRVGRYADAAEANRRAVKADEVYMDKAKPFGYYPMYLAHNHGFLAFATSMQGRAAESLSAARESAKNIPPAMMDMMPGMDFFATEPLLVMVRFGKFDELLAEPRPDPKYQVLTGLWLHAHGLALLAKGKIAEAKADLAELIALATAVGPDVVAGNNSARAVLAVAAKILEAASAGKDKSALALWAKAVELADGLAYSEPADWFYPVRHYYGQALLDSKQAKQAEAVYREDLRRNPGNGWALYGLMRALRAQKRDAEAADVDKQFRQAWTDADVQLTATRY